MNTARSGTSSFAAELRAQRSAQGWTQVELGKRIGYSGSFVSDVEHGDGPVLSVSAADWKRFTTAIKS